MRYHIVAFFAGFLLDLVFGDPYWLPHPVRLIGKLIVGIESRLRRNKDVNTIRSNQYKNKNQIEMRQGIVLVVTVLICVEAAVIPLLAAYLLHPYLGLAVETWMTYQILAAKCLKVESMKVYHRLKEGDLERARMAVSMIVGRDTDCLDAEGIAKAAIETVAENTSDGVVAPMLYLAFGGPILGFFYKAVNTMDSMIGYRNDTYLYFGRAAARLDDLVNYIPARISAYLMIAATFLFRGSQIGKNFSTSKDAVEYYSAKRAFSIYRRDRRKHASPNSAQTESVCAGALGIRLAGDAVYFGKTVAKPYIGDAFRAIEYEDIRRANHLMYGTAWLCEMLCLCGMIVCKLHSQLMI
ncbi:MAG: adenosylcobinamide-phosphate synthase CbiB [Eubacterium sp.]|nr:adenosylcobinamide-phosphate synthase CbiB [Eubacterium sp.]